VAAKTRYLGIMRAVGMTGSQLNKMILAEAAAYSLTGCAAGSILGVLLQRVLILNYLTHFSLKWRLPVAQLVIILFITTIVTAFSVVSPLKRIRSKGITEVINSL
ncbi:MAG TPA: ABC transporter permease, partial [Bacillota bacterium]|nr:ABC transporter permease [Bacillota bacterium]